MHGQGKNSHKTLRKESQKAKEKKNALCLHIESEQHGTFIYNMNENSFINSHVLQFILGL